ncbi:Zinc metallo ase nas-4 [Brachionus plicatilis]|uniref:Zinc metallo ase nas-4 n=1 Tax=Brachionus plicatilis TaxID=10195 RepID=A0A3M7SVM0_BRAPC|nr:Zinc metallo ase nas-4 [Brachionus plicatilis]
MDNRISACGHFLKDQNMFNIIFEIKISDNSRLQNFQKFKANEKSNLNLFIHELIHALGFVHEQSRPDRDFYKFPSSFGDIMGFKYDYDSIMHYSSFDFSKNGLPTIVPLQQANFLMNKFNQKVGSAIGLASRMLNDSEKIKILAIFCLSFHYLVYQNLFKMLKFCQSYLNNFEFGVQIKTNLYIFCSSTFPFPTGRVEEESRKRNVQASFIL